MVRRIRPVLVGLGVLLVVGTLLGARFLSPGGGGGGDSQPKSALAAPKGSGPVVIGFVDTDPQPATYGLPPIMQSGLVVRVFVKEGQEVKAGDPLFAFDASIPAAKLETQLATRDRVKVKVDEAKQALDQYAKKVELQKKVVEIAQDKIGLTAAAYKNVEKNKREFFATGGSTGATLERRIENDPDLFDLNIKHVLAKKDHDLQTAVLADLEAARPDLAIKLAEAGLKEADAAVAEAKAAVDLCTVKAHVAGTVEQIHVSAGTTMGVGTRGTAVSLIPAGPRIVRAEIEGDFAHRVGEDKKGKEVTIQDHTDGKLVYKGVVESIGTTFLPKRHAAGGLLGNETLVLEARVVVTDPNPTGKHPLRVGQKVRVNFGP
jgi:multidrug resistance efflux pump